MKQYTLKVSSSQLTEEQIDSEVLRVERDINDRNLIRVHIEAASDKPLTETFTPNEQEIWRRIEEKFTTLCKTHEVKWASQDYYHKQRYYFIGAIVALETQGIPYPPIWYLYIASNREIVDKF